MLSVNHKCITNTIRTPVVIKCDQRKRAMYGLKDVRFWLFREADTQNWKSLDTQALVNNLVKT